MSKVEVNQISSQCGSTLTIGQSGDTVTLACGATQSGFGRTGTVNWDTTKKTASFTAVSGNGYFVDTSSSAITMTLPASPSAGDIVGVKDYAGTFAVNNLTIGRNSEPINGGNASDVTISTDGASIFLVYVDATQGWVATQDDSSTFSGASYITATGGTITTCGNYKIHTFTGPGTFTVSCLGSAPSNNVVDYLVVAGGGAGTGNPNANSGGGGGAGGFRESSGESTGAYTASPLGACVSALPVLAQGYPITVGGGGAGVLNTIGSNGSNSVFSTITSTGGGRGGGPIPVGPDSGDGQPGGSGGGAGGGAPPGASGGSGNTPPVSPPQGNNGGSGGGVSPDHQSGAGGGAGGVGGNGTASNGGTGGVGVSTSISATETSYAGGGGGTGFAGSGGPSPCGTGGNGVIGAPGEDGTTNRGGGGGAGEGYDGAPGNAAGGSGGSGVVIIRYRYQ